MDKSNFNLAAAMRAALKANPTASGPEAMAWVRKKWPDVEFQDNSANTAYQRAKKRLDELLTRPIPVRPFPNPNNVALDEAADEAATLQARFAAAQRFLAFCDNDPATAHKAIDAVELLRGASKQVHQD